MFAMFHFLLYTCVLWSSVTQATFNRFTLHKVFKLHHSPFPSTQDPNQCFLRKYTGGMVGAMFKIDEEEEKLEGLLDKLMSCADGVLNLAEVHHKQESPHFALELRWSKTMCLFKETSKGKTSWDEVASPKVSFRSQSCMMEPNINSRKNLDNSSFTQDRGMKNCTCLAWNPSSSSLIEMMPAHSIFNPEEDAYILSELLPDFLKGQQDRCVNRTFTGCMEDFLARFLPPPEFSAREIETWNRKHTIVSQINGWRFHELKQL
ncbi:hypothetical protein F5146DRAFT_1005727 [Armillaria mellea]|nr:hypothetical protein F5146DRAFT_1005727 [Armillaria mellea]